VERGKVVKVKVVLLKKMDNVEVMAFSGRSTAKGVEVTAKLR
jgi:hypothetical protein